MANRRTDSILVGTALAVITAMTVFLGMAYAHPAENTREEFHQTYPMASDGRVELSNVSGNITITAWDSNEVKVDAVKRARDTERLQDCKIEVFATGNSIQIRTKYENPRKNNNNGADVDYEIKVPRHARLESIKNVSGQVLITGVQGAVSASTVSGHVRAEDVSGDLDLSTVSGSTEATLRRAGNRIRLSTVSGSVALKAPSELSAEVSGSTVSGGIHNDFGIPVHRDRFVGESMDGRVGSGEAHIELKTVSGSINLRRAG